MASIIIAGASTGIGSATAQLLRDHGHVVIGTGRKPHEERLLPLDVTDPDSINRFVAQIGEQPVNAFVYSVGYFLRGAAEDTQMDELMDQVEVNFLGAVRMTQAVLPRLRMQSQAKLIYLSSLGGVSALPFGSAYCASKHALEGYAESLRYELLPQNIFVSLVESGPVRTGTTATSIRSVQGESRYGVSAVELAQRTRDEGDASPLTKEDVARAIVNIIESDKPKLRYLIGTQARMVTTMRAVLPASLFEKLMVNRFVKPLL